MKRDLTEYPRRLWRRDGTWILRGKKNDLRLIFEAPTRFHAETVTAVESKP